MWAELIVVESNEDLAEAMSLVAELMGSKSEGDLARLRAQARLIEDFERRRWPRKAPTVPQLLHYLMGQHEMTRADLAPLLGGASRVSEALSGKTGLSLRQVRRLRDRFGISADLLLPPSGRRAAA